MALLVFVEDVDRFSTVPGLKADGLLLSQKVDADDALVPKTGLRRAFRAIGQPGQDRLGPRFRVQARGA